MDFNFRHADVVQPELEKEILIEYMKGKDGPFLTQGFLRDDAKMLGESDKGHKIRTTEWWRNQGYGLVYYDYAERKLQSLTAKKSKNRVVAWAYLYYDH